MKAPVKLTARRQIEFMKALKALGGSSGNTQLMDRLGWNKEFYGRVRDSLSDELRAGPGYGGTVHIKADTEEVTERDHRRTTFAHSLRCLSTRWIRLWKTILKQLKVEDNEDSNRSRYRARHQRRHTSRCRHTWTEGFLCW
jgi:hypothetical protein